MILTGDQRYAAVHRLDVDGPLVGRKTSKDHLWPGGVVPFTVDAAIGRTNKNEY